jgi:predicted DCC family thiol-disulfide oxidoreductase YuxK
MDVSGPVLLFDGECGLCVRCVRLLLVTDRRSLLCFAPLQGEAVQGFLRERGLPTEDFDSMIFVPDWVARRERALLFRTDALFAGLRVVGGAWLLLSWLRVLPKAWRDPAYRVVAKWRRRVFGAGDVVALYAEFTPGRFLP